MSRLHHTNDLPVDNANSANAANDEKQSGLSRRTFLKYSSVVAASSVPGLLAACSSTGFGGSNTSSSGGGGTVTINFWDMPWGGNSYPDVGKQLVKAFNDSHKGITVVYRTVPWTNWLQTFTTAVGSGAQPDISTGGSFMGAQFYASKNVLPLDDVLAEIKQNGQYDDYLPGVFAPTLYQGHTVTWPFGIDIRIPFYRQDLFQQAGVQVPTTWDEWRTVSKKLSTKGKYGQVNAGAANNVEHMLEMLMINNGGGLFTADAKLNFSENPRNMEALTFFANLVHDGSFDPASISYQGADAIAAFNRGDAAMIVDGPGLTKQMDANIAKNVGVIPPLMSPNGTKSTLYWINNLIVYAGTKHPNETKVFLKWWSQNNKPLWTQGTCSPLPIRSSYYQEPIFNTPNIAIIKSQYVPIAKSANAQATSIFPALNPLDGDGTLVTLGQNLLGKKDFTTSLQVAQTSLQKVVDSNPG